MTRHRRTEASAGGYRIRLRAFGRHHLLLGTTRLVIVTLRR